MNVMGGTTTLMSFADFERLDFEGPEETRRT
jgi:hypothetical protein